MKACLVFSSPLEGEDGAQRQKGGNEWITPHPSSHSLRKRLDTLPLKGGGKSYASTL